MAGGREWSEADKDTALRLQADGVKYAIIAKELGRSYKAVRSWLAKYGERTTHIPSEYVGQRHERLLVVGVGGQDKNGRYNLICRCDCGVTKEMRVDAFKRFKSCGCYSKDYHRDVIYDTQTSRQIRRMENKKANSSSRSGIKGVCFKNRDGVWKASLCVAGTEHQAYFTSKQNAIAHRYWLEETYGKKRISELKERELKERELKESCDDNNHPIR